MIAEKDNKVYMILPDQQAFYVGQGFDIKDDKGDVIAYGAGRTVPYGDYVALVKENEKLKAELAKSKSTKNSKKESTEKEGE